MVLFTGSFAALRMTANFEGGVTPPPQGEGFGARGTEGRRLRGWGAAYEGVQGEGEGVGDFDQELKGDFGMTVFQTGDG